MAQIERLAAAPAVIAHRGFVAPALCRRVIEAFEGLAGLHVAHDHDLGHRVLHFAALGTAGRRMNEFGQLVADPGPGSSLKAWLNTLRAQIPVEFGLGPLYPELTLICRAPQGSVMPAHKDFAWRDYSAVLYLNDDFNGGETCFEDGTRVRPETGKLVIFKGSEIGHEVAPVRSGSRYNVSLWWTRDHLRLEA